ncbi:MAG: hypothetical protein ABL891_11210 [Burkholderiales bacterium]
MRLRSTALLLVCIVVLPGCATITSSEMQDLSLQTANDKGEMLKDVKCTLKNDKGNWEFKAPGFVAVRRSAEDLIVECKKEGSADGFLRAVSRAAGGMWGNIIFGGGIGAIIDHSKGTGYNYPDSLPVVMGKSISVDRANQQSGEAGLGAPQNPAQQSTPAESKPIPVPPAPTTTQAADKPAADPKPDP